jgi:hypothetical protein
MVAVDEGKGGTMPYAEQWQAIAAHIRGLARAGELHARYLGVRDSDSFGRGQRLSAQAKRIVTTIRDYRGSSDTLPIAIARCIDALLADAGGVIEGQQGKSLEEHALWHGLVLLSALEAEVSYLLSDTQELLRSRSELAFTHLQRLLVVDDDVRKKWWMALEAGELRCEQLGSAHLLWHGIWAFKINAAGARTDLVFPEPLDVSMSRSALGLVLTEWKVADAKSAAQQFGIARDQGNLYARGPLASTELRAYRYAVVVSQEGVEVPYDVRVGSTVWRHINIAVAPQRPSRAARRTTQASQLKRKVE